MSSQSATLPLSGLKIVLSGTFPTHGHAALQKRIEALGGSVNKTLSAMTKLLMTTKEDFDLGKLKVETAQKLTLPIVGLYWLDECEKSKTLAPTATFHPSPAGLGAAATTTAAQTTTTVSTRPSRKRNAPKRSLSDDEDSRQVKKQKNGTSVADADSKDRLGNAQDAEDKSTALTDRKDEQTDGSTDEKETRKRKVKAGKKAQEIAIPKQKVAVAADGKYQYAKSIAFCVPRDKNCDFVDYQVYICPETLLIWDARLHSTDVRLNQNKYYLIQVLFDPVRNRFLTWTSWGRYDGTSNANCASLGDGTQQTAFAIFERKFRAKTGLKWEDRNADPCPNKYSLVKKNYEAPESQSDTRDSTSAKREYVQCTLAPAVQNLLRFIFDKKNLDTTMKALNYDSSIPLKSLTKDTIYRGYDTLKRLADLITDDSGNAGTVHRTADYNTLATLSSSYYSTIPHCFSGRSKPPILSTLQQIKTEIELLDSLTDMKVADEVMKKSVTEVEVERPIHPLDRQFLQLDLTEMTPLDPTGQEWMHLSQYLLGTKGATHHLHYQIQDIFRISRVGEDARFMQLPTGRSDRRLLWHGSRSTNFGGILSQGLRIAPPEAPVSGYVFGKGIYLADMSSKSANYCHASASLGTGLLLLCEAELATPALSLTNASYTAEQEAAQQNSLSTWGMGRTGPKAWKDASFIHPSLKDVQVPDVATLEDNRPHGTLLYNEYICYKVSQVKLRYLFRIKM